MRICVVSFVIICQPLGQGCQCVNDLVVGHFKVKIRKRTALIQVWLIDEVPTTLEPKAFAFDLVSETSALSERALSLRLMVSQCLIELLERAELVQG